MSNNGRRHPLSPRDNTKIKIDGIEVEEKSIKPIIDESSESDTDTEVSSTEEEKQPEKTTKKEPVEILSSRKQELPKVEKEKEDGEVTVDTSIEKEPTSETKKVEEDKQPTKTLGTSKEQISEPKKNDEVVSSKPSQTKIKKKQKDSKPKKKKKQPLTPEKKKEIYEDYVVRYRILQSKNPDIKITIPSFDKGLAVVASRYQSFLKLIYSNKKPCFYRNCLMISWLVIEIIGIKFGLDMSGYTMNQISSLEDYEYLLIELGENPYDSIAEDWPPMVRIGVLSLINAAMFLLIKYLSGVIGPDMAKQLKGMVSQLMSGTGNGRTSDKQDNGGGFGSIISMISSMMSGSNTAEPSKGVDMFSGPKHKS